MSTTITSVTSAAIVRFCRIDRDSRQDMGANRLQDRCPEDGSVERREDPGERDRDRDDQKQKGLVL